MKQINIAVIGGGSAAAVFLRFFVDNILPFENCSIRITLFEKAAEVGSGLAYQKDLPNLLINRPLQSMSAHPRQADEFQTWLEANPQYSSQVIVDAKSASDNRSYVPREIFGVYLQELIENVRQAALQKNISFESVNSEVENISQASPFIIKTKNQISYSANYVVLCTGNNAPVDIYNLSGNRNYINQPYPFMRLVKQIKPDARVGIIGRSLTAIDIALSLRASGHRGKVAMLSRGHLVPRVRGRMPKMELQHFTKENVLKIARKQGSLSLRSALRLFRRELQVQGMHWKEIFTASPQHKSFDELLRQEIIAAKSERKWQSILSATNQVIEICWHYLDSKSKEIFMQQYNRVWLNNRSPIPLANARKILEMLEDNQLEVYHSLNDIRYDSAKEKFIAAVGHDTQIEYDYIINATGPSRYVGSQDALLFGMLRDGMVRENMFGGLDVEFRSASVVDSEGMINPYMRLMGHNTTGVYYYTSSLEMLANRAKNVAEDLVEFIVENILYGKNSMAHTAAAYRASHTAATLG